MPSTKYATSPWNRLKQTLPILLYPCLSYVNNITNLKIITLFLFKKNNGIESNYPSSTSNISKFVPEEVNSLNDLDFSRWWTYGRAKGTIRKFAVGITQTRKLFVHRSFWSELRFLSFRRKVRRGRGSSRQNRFNPR